jgi:hypothetical protein
VIRVVERTPGGSRRTIWTPPDAPDGRRDDGSITVELGFGRPGHPSSYGLLGARATDQPTAFGVPIDGPRWYGAARTAEAYFGLPEEYRRAILAVRPTGLLVTVGAHSRWASSNIVFGVLAEEVARLLSLGVPNEDAEVWKLVDGTGDVVCAALGMS